MFLIRPYLFLVKARRQLLLPRKSKWQRREKRLGINTDFPPNYSIFYLGYNTQRLCFVICCDRSRWYHLRRSFTDGIGQLRQKTRSHASGGIQWASFPSHLILQPMGLVRGVLTGFPTRCSSKARSRSLTVILLVSLGLSTPRPV